MTSGGDIGSRRRENTEENNLKKETTETEKIHNYKNKPKQNNTEEPQDNSVFSVKHGRS